VVGFGEVADRAVDDGTWGECCRDARAHGVNANQVFTWRRLFDNSQLSDAGARSTALLPVADHPINRIGEFLPWNLAASLQSESAEAA
jgi:transposase-like protein